MLYRSHRTMNAGLTAAGAPPAAPHRRPGTRRIRGRPPHRDAGAFWPERSLARRLSGGNCRADQRLEYCGALRAFLSPAFLRSMMRASRVRKARAEEHTAELQSRGHLVCRLLLDKKNGLDVRRTQH